MLLLILFAVSGGLAGAARAQGEAHTPYAVPRSYATACGTCHANNGFAVQTLAKRLGKNQSILTERTDLTSELIRLAVRHGLGAMPPMSKAEVSDRELNGIVATLTAKRP